MPNVGFPDLFLAVFGTLGATELIIILIIVILIFGVNKIPQLGKGLGEGIRNFKTSIKAVNEDVEDKKEDKSKEEK